MTTTKRRPLKTVPQVIKAFGGAKAVAEWSGVSTCHVDNWRRWKFISPAWHWRMDVELKRRGYKIDPQVFGVDIKAPRQRPKTGGVHV